MSKEKGFRRCFIYLIHASIALLIGLGYYMWRRPTAAITLLVHKLASATLSDIPCPFAGSVWMNFVDGHLADFLWAYTLTFCIGAVYYGKRNWRTGLIMCLIADCVMELMQGFHLLRGTFDWMDIFVQLGATLLVQWMINRMERRNKYV